MTSGAEPVGVVLAVDPDRFDEVVEAARRIGLAVTAEQPLLGTLSGSIPEDRIARLQVLDGVDSVDRERTYRLPPPDSPVQ
ncbi:hypothetical protein [Streptomyces sp. NPDC001843]|uniref:hypothetical protein n=1 Tax=Streptomyces sp. NPDC001843 TaxID=3364617 RepID=UPI0036826465